MSPAQDDVAVGELKAHPLLRLENVSKSFAGVPALSNVKFDLRPGEVHALAGENGAGKSTFIKIISGAYTPDSGTITIQGTDFEKLTPKEALDHGIAVVYQEFNLLTELTVAENMFVGQLPGSRFGTYSPHQAVAEARQILARLGTDLDPTRLVNELTVAEQQLVEIGKALAKDAQIIIMDEPSTVLANNELAVLHNVVNRLKEEKRAIIYISHRLNEVLELADRVTIFKDGQHVLTTETSALTHDSLIANMIGRDLGDFFPDLQPHRGNDLLRVDAISVPAKIFDVSLSVHEGEILGLAGLGGSGKTTLCRALIGLEKLSAGSITLYGKPAPRSPGKASKVGLVMVPEDRKSHGIFAGHSVAFNVTLAALSKLKRFLLLSLGKERRLIETSFSELDVRPKNPALDIAHLSGGNQQKVVLARWLSQNPRVIVLDEPTRGVDVGAKAEIYSIIEKLRREGAAIILASSDVTELLGMCDRIAVFHEGRVVQTIQREDATEERIIRAATNDISENESAPPIETSNF